MHDAHRQFEQAQQRVLDRYRVDVESRFVDVPRIDGRAHVLVGGEGPPLVMAPGGGLVAALWAPLMERLDGFTLYAFDPPGHGLSDPATYRAGTIRSTAVEFLGQLLDGLGLERAPFAANSMGGLWTSWLALDRPDRVSAISYIGCPALMLGTSAPLPLRLGTIRRLHQLVERLQPPSPKQVERLGRMAGEPLDELPELRDLLLAAERLPAFSSQLFDIHRALVRVRGARPEVALTAERLAGVTQPVQLIWGDHDPFGSPAVGRRAAQIIGDAECHVVDGGHGPWFTGSGAIAPLLTRFLDRCSSGARTDRTDHLDETEESR